jgi:predicted transposase YdaD
MIERMEARLGRRSARGLAGQLWSATYILMGLCYSRAVAQQLLRGVVSMKESVTYQAILEEGEAKGRAEGAVDELRKVVLLQSRDRFGRPDAQVVAALEGIADVERLEELARRLLRVGSWQELLTQAPPRRRGGRRPRGS